jgi:hypothetical protein
MKPTWNDLKHWFDSKKLNLEDDGWQPAYQTDAYVSDTYDKCLADPSVYTAIFQRFCRDWSQGDLGTCLHCGESIATRNPAGYCDHLQYPDYCDICNSKLSPEELRRIARLLDGNEFWDDSVKMMIWAARLEGELK